MRREKQATELVPGARFRELGEDKTRLRRGRSNFSAVPSLFLSCRAPCDATKVHAPRIRGTLPASHTEYPGSDWIPFFLFQRLKSLWKDLRRKIRSNISIYRYQRLNDLLIIFQFFQVYEFLFCICFCISY